MGTPIPAEFFTENRKRLAARILLQLRCQPRRERQRRAADQCRRLRWPFGAEFDLFYLSGVEQEESILLLYPQAFEEQFREVLFLRQPNEELKTWEGHKLSKDEAQSVSGVKTIKWLGDFPKIFRGLMCDAEHVYLNSNEHKRAACEVQTRDDRFIAKVKKRYPLHSYHRLARLLHLLRVVKSDEEITLIRRAAEITEQSYRRVLNMLRPGVMEYEVEAEFAYEYTRNRARFAYPPIVAAGNNSCVLHYNENDQMCNDRDVLLLDVAASYANYNADVTRTFPVNGRFTPRQRQIYDAVLRVMRASRAGAVVGKLHRDWQREAQRMMNDELLRLELIKQEDIDKQAVLEPACRKYFMHGLGHPLGLDVHDVGLLNEPFAPGWVLTVEPGIYLPEDGFGIRLENDILVTDRGPVDLTPAIPVEADEIEEIMNSRNA